MVTVNSVALKQRTSDAVPNVEVSEVGDLIFLLAELWELKSDSIKRHWVLNLFASGHGDHGREVYTTHTHTDRHTRACTHTLGKVARLCLYEAIILFLNHRPMLSMCTQVFLGISDKSKVSQELLSLAGCIADHLIHKIDVKSEKLALIAQIPPSLLEWLRNQVRRCMVPSMSA